MAAATNTIVLNRDSRNFLNIVEKRSSQVLNGKNLTQLPTDQARKAFNQLTAPIPNKLQPIDINVENKTITYNNSIKLNLRLYTPKNAKGALPILVYFHGGGFVFGDLDFLDYTARYLANGSNIIVATIDYRRAPENKFPAAHDDAYNATKYIYEHAKEFGGNGKIAVGGDSAGGNLAANVCHIAKKTKEIPINFQLLFYPWVDLNNVRESDKKFAKGFFLELDLLNWMRTQYLASPADQKNPIANPQLQADFKDLPPAFIVIGEDDPIHDDAKMYYEKLVNAGNDAQYAEFGGILHDFCALPSHYEAALLAFDMSCNELKKAFGTTH